MSLPQAQGTVVSLSGWDTAVSKMLDQRGHRANLQGVPVTSMK